MENAQGQVQAADLPDTGSGRPRPGWVGEQSARLLFFFCLGVILIQSLHPQSTHLKHPIYLSYLFIWIAVKQMFTLK